MASKRKTTPATPDSSTTQPAKASDGSNAAGIENATAAEAAKDAASTDAPQAPAAGLGDEAQGSSAQPAATHHIASGDTPMTAETEAAIVSGATIAAAQLDAKPKLAVTAFVNRRRRHGIDFGRTETPLDPEAIGEDGFRALVGDPLLKVEIVFRNGKRVRLTAFPPAGDVQKQIEALAAEDAAGNAGP